MNIMEIYEKYLIPENLQMHMLRVAACGKIILDNWKGPKIDKDSIIRMLLVHDMGNIVKITPDQNNNKDFLNFRQKMMNKYGNDDHLANDGICKEIEIMNSKILKNNPLTVDSNSYEVKVCAYCD